MEIRSSEYASSSERPKLTVTYLSTNLPPAQPVLVAPLDGATNVSTPPELSVTVTDPEADTMDVTFYGRPAGETAGEDFTIIALPDTQFYSQSYPSIFTSQTTWIKDQKTAQNIIFVVNEGDITNADDTTQWGNADTAIDILDTWDVPYSMIPGNHDGLTNFNNYFGSSRYTGKTYYQGHYSSGNENNYSFFTASGMDFMVIGLQYSPTAAVLDWADALLKANTDRRAIVLTHSLLNTDTSWTDSGAIYDALKDNPNLGLMLCGHNHGEAKRTDTYNGSTIHSLLADYQGYSNGGNGYLRILKFLPANDTIEVTTYSPTVPGFETDAGSQFSLDYAMDVPAAFQVIGTVNDVASGSVASLPWDGLADNTEYDWYAVANDGIANTTSSIWSFTTENAAVNQPPVVTGIPDQTIAEGASFATINLDDYVSDIDNTDAEMVWSYSGNTSLTVSIVDRVATIGIPGADWNGAETITFRATDPGALFDDDAAAFTVTAVNDAPLITESDPQPVNMSKNGLPLGFALTLNATDVEGDTLTWSISNPASHGAAAASGTGASKAIDYSPTLNYIGADTFVVQVSDGNGGLDTLTVNVTILDRHSIDLLAGWNLVSFNMHPANTAIVDVLASIAGNYSLVYAWDSATQTWLKYDPNAEFGNTLDTLDETVGVWIQMNAAGTLHIVGNAPGISDIDLKTGWNLVAYPSAVSLPLPGALTDHGVTNFSMVLASHASDTSDPWKLYDSSAPPYASDLNEMTPGWGYWIYVLADSTWTIPYTP